MEGVALPMYDLPECRAATDALVGALAETIGLVQSEPSADRERARADQREMERQLDARPPALTQMCGASLATRLESGASMLVPIGAPCYTVPGCDDGGVATRATCRHIRGQICGIRWDRLSAKVQPKFIITVDITFILAVKRFLEERTYWVGSTGPST